MQKINSMEELRELCLSQEFYNKYKFITCDPVFFGEPNGELAIFLWTEKPTFWNKKEWKCFNECSVRSINCNIELTFDCDFKECCWEIEKCT